MSEYTVETLTKAYTQLRDKRAELKKEYDITDSRVKEKMDAIEVRLMSKLTEFGVDSVKTPYGTVFTQTETKYNCTDWTTFWNWMYENERMDVLEKRVSQKAMRELEDGQEGLPPAIDVHKERVIRVRRT